MTRRVEAKFKTYAEFRIRGAMLDEMRSMDWIPRSVHERRLDVRTSQRGSPQQARTSAERRGARGSFELSVQLNSPNISRGRRAAVLISLDDLGMQETDGRKLLRLLVDSIIPIRWPPVVTEHRRAEIGEDHRSIAEEGTLVLILYYCEELTMKEIGRISAVHRVACVPIAYESDSFIEVHAA